MVQFVFKFMVIGFLGPMRKRVVSASILMPGEGNDQQCSDNEQKNHLVIFVLPVMGFH